ncbi:metallophosphoesterase [Paenibacillus athensensis]|nr:metallophosphoesterase [Paenibacillus athensensis]MCD1258708.1 metallophosphoesterase [Paenibacillus athensensis]
MDYGGNQVRIACLTLTLLAALSGTASAQAGSLERTSGIRQEISEPAAASVSLQRPGRSGRGEAAPALSFSVLSDLHVTSWDGESQRKFTTALDDHAALRPASSLLVLNGDLTDGEAADYRTLLAELVKHRHAPMHATMGNHEYYRMWRTPDGGMDTTRLNPDWSTRQAVQQFTQLLGYDKPYHELTLQGYHFLFASGEAYRDVQPDVKEDAYLSDKQFAWLADRLAAAGTESATKPIFVFIHQPLPHTLDGTEFERGIVQADRLNALLARYPQAIVFSGHTHWNLEKTRQIKELGFLAVGSSSVRRIWNGRNEPGEQAASQSLVVDVYPDRVVIRGREHSLRRWAGPEYVRKTALPQQSAAAAR